MTRTKAKRKPSRMSAFKGDPKLKAFYLSRVRKHAKADEIAQGVGYKKNGKLQTCCIGCLAEEYPAHAKLAAEWDAPEELFRLADSIHEGLPLADAKLWPKRFTSAITVGADLSMIWPKFALWMLADETNGVIRFAGDDAKVRDAILSVATLYREWIDSGVKPSEARWSAAAAAARWSAAAWKAMADKLTELLAQA